MSQINDIDREYRNYRQAYRDAVSAAVSTSVTLSGTASKHGRQYWSSILFTKLCLTSMTIDRIIPKNHSSVDNDLWDLASIASLARQLVENYLLAHWLCIEPNEEDLWIFRFTLMQIVDNRSRYKLVHDLNREVNDHEYLRAQSDLIDRLKSMALFRALPEKKKNELMRGDKMPFIQDNVIDSLEIDRVSFRSLYRYLSSFVHTGTVSFFRMEEQKRGNGEKNEYETNAIRGILEFITQVVIQATDDIKRIHNV